jgi:hypothetical protein
MPEEKERIKEFFSAKKEQLSQKIEKTPMERFFLFFLILITISAAVLGYFQFKKNIEVPMYSSYLRENRGLMREKYAVPNLNVVQPSEDTLKLQNQDSDLDGLSDYSEIYLYHTSAYNEDSDSDGILDKAEIISGSDPNCPSGTVCNKVVPSPGPEIASGSANNLNQDLQADKVQTFDLSNFTDIQNKLLSGEITLQQLGINDPQLQALLEQAQQAQKTVGAGTGESNINISPEDQQAAWDSLQNMSTDQIRQELVARGIDPALLSQIDDATLKQIFVETLGGLAPSQ